MDSFQTESALAARAKIRPPCALKHRVQQDYNSSLVNALNRIFKSNQALNSFKWLLTKLELSCVRNIISISEAFSRTGYPRSKITTPLGGTYPYRLCMGVPPTPPPPGVSTVIPCKEIRDTAFSVFIRSLRFFFFNKFFCFIIYGQHAGHAANSSAQTLLAQVKWGRRWGRRRRKRVVSGFIIQRWGPESLAKDQQTKDAFA